MPSNKNPNSTVQSGPGRLPAGVVPAGALLFPPGAGSAAALQAHITEPLDAHMASAIGINPVNPTTGEQLLWPDGVIDGESVLDYIVQFKDLLPNYPNFVGFDLPSGINSGVPNWDTVRPVLTGGTAKTAGFAYGVNTVSTHYAVPTTTTLFNVTGLVFPADRGVLAFYKNTDGNFFNPGATTLEAAIWLGGFPPPAGYTSANFNEALRTGQQLNYVPSGVGIDKIGLTFRLPYLKNYTPYVGAPYAPYATDFFRFQLATFAMPTQSLAGGYQNYLIVHWKQPYALLLANIQPVNLFVGMVAANCYSAVPLLANFDDPTSAIVNVNRHHLFRDLASAGAPTLNTFTTVTGAPLPAIAFLSGIAFANDTNLRFNITLAANNLFSNVFDTGTVANPPHVPTGYTTDFDPMSLSFSEFGGGSKILPYTLLRKQGIPGVYSNVHAPQPTDIGEYLVTNLAITTPVPFTMSTGVDYSKLSATLHNIFNPGVPVVDVSRQFLFNTFPQTGGGTQSTATFEPFLDEKYRYTTLHVPVPADRIVPTGGADFDSTLALTADLNSLQVIGNALRYPFVDYSTATWYPIQGGAPQNYSGLPGSDGIYHRRRYVRTFNTSIPRNTGKLRIRGLTAVSFKANSPYDGLENTGHEGFGDCIIQVMVPGQTGWLDLGRELGDPTVLTPDFYGCLTAIETIGPDVFATFQTTLFTVNNGFGEFPLMVRVTYLNSGTSIGHRLDEIEWMPA